MPIYSRLKILAAEKEVKRGRKLTYREIAEETGLPLNTVSKYMTPQGVTRFEAETLERLCQYFQCNIGDLLVYVE